MITIVLTGGGSGGHITPLLAVAAELKRKRSDIRLVYIGQRGDGLGDIPAAHAAIDEVLTVRAGKFRRYHGESLLRQLLDIPTMVKNIRDFFYVLIGMVQSWRILRRLRPDIVFIKGGFVGVPVGLASAVLHIPYVTHDSDAIPGLANRIISPWATKHAVALPTNSYKYPSAKTVTTGIPLQADFEPVSDKLKQKYRADLKLPAEAKVLFVIGGGLGSQRVNQAVAEAVPHLLHEFRDLHVIHAVGRANKLDMKTVYADKLSEAEQGRLRIYDYLDDVYRYSGAADVIITRAGATNLAEFALQGKACIVVPSSFLAGGHQLKNAKYLADHQAALVLSETDLAADPNRLAGQVSELLSNPQRRLDLGAELAKFARPKATQELAQLILDQVKK
ncbi:MAG: UDP-N-acetylglucosamine--N-acetylmuramyl-(pentapeptide) pyrophosphoryl-undecaprenol N-acetylglucosamine transferase [Patescibacteria group bacterium]